jgi:hypothetical protein
MISPSARKELDTHQTVQRVLITLRDQIGLSERDIAQVTGAHVRSVRRWLSGTDPHQGTAERIDDLRTIVTDLGQMLPPESIVAWMRNRNPMLDRRRPLDVLAEDGGYDLVAAAAEALLSGDYV